MSPGTPIPERSIRLDGPDGAPLSGRGWSPPEPWGAVLALHGSVSHAGWFAGVAAPLAAAGLAVVAFDRPGWGLSDGPRGHLPGLAAALRHVYAAAGWVRARHGGVHLLGLSWGGLLALRAAMGDARAFDTVTLVAPGLADKRPTGLGTAARAAAAWLTGDRGYRIVLDYAPEDCTRDPDRQASIRGDPLYVRGVSAGFAWATRLMRRQTAAWAGRKTLPPCQCLLAGKDTIADNRPAEALARRAGIPVTVYGDAAHSLVFEEPGRVAADIVSLARKNGPASGGRGLA